MLFLQWDKKGRFKLPRNNWFFQSGILGQFTSAGLPNITGGFILSGVGSSNTGLATYTEGAFSLYGTASTSKMSPNSSATGANRYNRVDLDASI